MKRLPISILLLALLCLPQNSCRTTLHHAAAKGDIATVRRELKAGAHPNLCNTLDGTFLGVLTNTPILIAAPFIDITLAICTLGAYVRNGRMDGMPLTQWLIKTPLDEALDHGHYDVASLLREYGATATYSKHYYGDFTTPATEEPKVGKKKKAQPAKNTPQYQRPTYENPREAPQPTLSDGSGSISTH